MKFKNTLIVFVLASAVAAIPVLIWANAHQDWMQMLQAPLFGLATAIAVAVLAGGWRSFQTDQHIKDNGLLFNDGEGPYLLPALGILLLTFFALNSLGHEGTVEGTNDWLLNYTYVRWAWIIIYGIVSFFWWLLCWLPAPSPTLGFKTSVGISTCLLVVGGWTNGYGYFNLHGLVLCGATLAVNCAFFIVFGLLSLVVRHNKRKYH